MLAWRWPWRAGVLQQALEITHPTRPVCPRLPEAWPAQPAVPSAGRTGKNSGVAAWWGGQWRFAFVMTVFGWGEMRWLGGMLLNAWRAKANPQPGAGPQQAWCWPMKRNANWWAMAMQFGARIRQEVFSDAPASKAGRENLSKAPRLRWICQQTSRTSWPDAENFVICLPLAANKFAQRAARASPHASGIGW